MPLDTPSPEAETPLTETALVPVRHRDDGWTPQRQRAFLEVLADTGSVTAAAEAVGMSKGSAYRLRGRADARAFDAAWNAALERAMQRLFPAAIDRALNGAVRQRFYHGDLIAEDRVYSDRMLIWLLEKGKDMLPGGALRREIASTSNWERVMDALEGGDPEPPPLTTREPFSAWMSGGKWLTNFPPPPGFRGFEDGRTGSSDYCRAMTREEHEGLMRRRELAVGSDEAARRRFFGLPPQTEVEVEAAKIPRKSRRNAGR